jgi:hypothetical protein
MKEKEVKKSMKEKGVKKSKGVSLDLEDPKSEVKKNGEVSLNLEDTKSVVKYKEHLRNLISIVKLEAEYEELMAKKMMMIVNQYRAADALNTYQSGVGKNGVEKSDEVVKDGK